jgi:hypothetical protein
VIAVVTAIVYDNPSKIKVPIYPFHLILYRKKNETNSLKVENKILFIIAIENLQKIKVII